MTSGVGPAAHARARRGGCGARRPHGRRRPRALGRPQRGPRRGRATDDVVAFVDDDALSGPGWLDALRPLAARRRRRRLHRRRDPAALDGRPAGLGQRADLHRLLAARPRAGRRRARPGRRRATPGGRTSASAPGPLREVGGFDPAPRRMGGPCRCSATSRRSSGASPSGATASSTRRRPRRAPCRRRAPAAARALAARALPRRQRRARRARSRRRRPPPRARRRPPASPWRWSRRDAPLAGERFARLARSARRRRRAAAAPAAPPPGMAGDERAAADRLAGHHRRLGGERGASSQRALERLGVEHRGRAAQPRARSATCGAPGSGRWSTRSRRPRRPPGAGGGAARGRRLRGDPPQHDRRAAGCRCGGCAPQGIPVAIRIDCPSSISRPGPQNAAQRALERRRLAEATLRWRPGPRSAELLSALSREVASLPVPVEVAAGGCRRGGQRRRRRPHLRGRPRQQGPRPGLPGLVGARRRDRRPAPARHRGLRRARPPPAVREGGSPSRRACAGTAT